MQKRQRGKKKKKIIFLGDFFLTSSFAVFLLRHLERKKGRRKYENFHPDSLDGNDECAECRSDATLCELSWISAKCFFFYTVCEPIYWLFPQRNYRTFPKNLKKKFDTAECKFVWQYICD